MIEITLVLKQKELDILIPSKITFGRLRDLVKEALIENGIKLPADFKLVIQDKTFKIGYFDFISDFGISNGDKLEIELGEANEAI
ncbi:MULTISPECIES: hypothetical protein [unclassified Enterococcus]|uniref:hypothetical protein n=1 Tax=unclassified Enterococcus TaxID=2608891 RepID=UPI001557A717|nr:MULTISPECIES: hypothetical protein [unclassified Enterococcus]MBS7576412.1 hypothetical protein [Enterococcus sp. MMGLQ5-2]MBS7583644.1 hypothetical protein [Enterococcus sp. MMGLQ5-1]NPD11505.1 hypothetical protein [Enterococcus sp. MMGLQ5-1]NPD36249.1 hypothetical protein [Enterococcus sp. MMGLQ5-2]